MLPGRRRAVPGRRGLIATHVRPPSPGTELNPTARSRGGPVDFLGDLLGRWRRPAELSDRAVQRLARLGYVGESDLEPWRRLWRHDGERSFWGRLFEEEHAEGYRRWFPRLQAFAADCRRAVPIPDPTCISAAARAQHRILLAKMRKSACEDGPTSPQRQRPNRAVILSTTRVGLAAAREVFGETDAVILQDSELQRWFAEVYSRDRDDGPLWWHSVYWWTLREGPDEVDRRLGVSCPTPDDGICWIVEEGESFGPLSGGSRSEFWRWDGRQAEFIRVYRLCISLSGLHPCKGPRRSPPRFSHSGT